MELTEEQIERLTQRYATSKYKEPCPIEIDAQYFSSLVYDLKTIDDWIAFFITYRDRHRDAEIIIDNDDDGGTWMKVRRMETPEETAKRIEDTRREAVDALHKRQNALMREIDQLNWLNANKKDPKATFG